MELAVQRERCTQPSTQVGENEMTGCPTAPSADTSLMLEGGEKLVAQEEGVFAQERVPLLR